MKSFLFRSFSVRAAILVLLGGAVLAQVQPPATPEDSVKRMKVADGFEVKLVASEPVVRKPVTMSFDDGGRLWVIQYLQYPAPAGLKPVKVDQYLRTEYDRVPEPPPKGPRGADRVTILEDPDGTGRFRKGKDVITGLNLATGMALGHGGVYIAQPPYLLFYRLKEGTDEVAGDPEVLLTGFGMEDSHAFPNSLQWGPDGWLYGAQGSTVTAKIRGIEFQQGIWRYHPKTKEFELFAEGGGNTWGVDFDRHGNIMAGTNWGGQALLHQVQGGYYIKGFGKHGPLHNPYTFGYFDHVPYQGFKGGHVTCGGVLYTGGAWPEQYRDHYIAANLLSNAIYWHRIDRQGSSFTARFGGDLVATDDTWFRPVDCLVGPDGSVYVADWCDKRANHVDPVDNWDRTKGRIYKIVYTASRGRQPPDKGQNPGADAHGLLKTPLSKMSSKELVGLLSHSNDWYAREARRILGERRDSGVFPQLRQMIEDNKGQLALEALWALYVSGGFDDALADKLLNHPNEDVRTWTVRYLGDPKKVSAALRDRLVSVARGDTSPTVRSQLACTAKRLPGRDALPIIHELLQHKEDVTDPHIPLLIWWAIEDKAISDRDQVLGLLDSPASWRTALVSKFIVERLARRYAAGGTDADFATCAKLLAATPGPAEGDLVVRGIEKALEGRHFKTVPAPLEKPLAALWEKQSGNVTVVRLALRLGSMDAFRRSQEMAADAKLPANERVGLIEILGQIGNAECVPALLKLLAAKEDGKVQAAALAALQPFPDKSVADAVLELYPRLSPDLRKRAQALLCGRPTSTLAFLKAVDAGQISPKEVPLDQLQRMVLYKDKEVARLVEKHWGKVGAASSGEKTSRMRSIANMLRNGKGEPAKGKLLFAKNCGTCHVLFGEGNKVGPELTGVDRKNLDFLLTSIVDPSAFIRPEFVAHVVTTKDGRVLTGLIADSTPKAVTLLDAKNERTVIAKENIDEMAPSPSSLMPEKILDPLDDQEIRDLFSYLRSDGPGK